MNTLRNNACLAGVLATVLCACIAPPPRLDPFYTPPQPLPADQPGAIIRVAPVAAAQLDGAKLWRIMYHSTLADGTDVPVSGLIAQPAGQAPADGFPVIAIAHGTSGIARSCAPSVNVLTTNPLQPGYYEREMKPFVDAGYVVVATDYVGMGAPGPYSYLVGQVEGRNVLDSIRALRAFGQSPISDNVFIRGVSQGGHAAAFAGEMAASYTPEITLTGVVMEAPAAELTDLVNAAFASDQRAAITGLAMYIAGAWSTVYPDVTIDSILTERGKRDLSVAYNKCLFAEVIDFLVAPTTAYFKTNPATVPAWAAHLTANTPGQAPILAPVFVGQGTEDPIVLPATTNVFVSRMCSLGNTVQFKTYPGAKHLNIDTYARADVLAWMAARLRDESAPSTCASATS